MACRSSYLLRLAAANRDVMEPPVEEGGPNKRTLFAFMPPIRFVLPGVVRMLNKERSCRTSEDMVKRLLFVSPKYERFFKGWMRICSIRFARDRGSNARTIKFMDQVIGQHARHEVSKPRQVQREMDGWLYNVYVDCRGTGPVYAYAVGFYRRTCTGRVADLRGDDDP